MYNLYNVLPIDPPRVNYYYTGVFNTLKNSGVKSEELIEVKKALSGSAVEDYFPMVIDCMNRRGNWKMLSTYDAINIHKLDFSWTNSSKINTKSAIHSRLQLDSVDHYISNKRAFYERFRHYEFIPVYEPFTKETIYMKKDILENKFEGKEVIIKPDLGSVATGIMCQKMYNYDDIINHINTWNYDTWTISEVIQAKLHDGYIVSNRIYFLVSKETTYNKSIINGYMYTNFMNYRAANKFAGNITNPEEFLTNHYSKIDLEADAIFVKTRYIPNELYMKNFTIDEQQIIHNKLTHMFKIICDSMADDLLTDNENMVHLSSSVSGFHIYGADILIDKELNVKIIEMNGAPAMNIKTRLYNLSDRLDYFDLFEEAFQKVVDPIFPPLNKQPELNTFELVHSVTKYVDKLPLYYIPNSIVTTYPYILDALKKRPYMKRTKNMHDNIELFYGLRERYVTDETSMNYYDEILNYLTSKRTRNAAIINKIQGITYYLANKGRMYNKLLQYKSKDEIHKYHPISEMLFYDGNDEFITQKINEIINNYPSIKNWIVKPVHGSRGKGIEIFKHDDPRLNFLNDKIKRSLLKIRISDYICESSNIPETSTIITETIKRFNGMDLMTNTNTNKQSDLIVNSLSHKYWIISEYIDNPHLLKLNNDIVGRKYNIRAYALVSIDKPLPTHKSINNHIDNQEIIKLHMYNDFMIYYSMLEYKKYELTDIPEKYKKLDLNKYLDKMINLTNLEVVNNVYTELNLHNKSEAKKELTNVLSKVDNIDKESIMKQAENIIRDTINSVKYDLRPLNRHNDNYKGCFNLLAYDLLLDDNGILHLIEINRGPDLKGLEMNIGYEAMTSFFDEIFKLTLDNKYTNNGCDVKYWKKIPITYNAINFPTNS